MIKIDQIIRRFGASGLTLAAAWLMMSAPSHAQVFSFGGAQGGTACASGPAL